MLKQVIVTDDKLQSRLSAKLAQAVSGTVLTGFATAYALAMHERTPGEPNPPRSPRQRAAMMASIKEREERGHVPWSVGQPKFLEAPARSNREKYLRIVADSLAKGLPLIVAVYNAGLDFQRDAQRLVPVDTGNLKNSAFTTREK